jgi:hypothetical protein
MRPLRRSADAGRPAYSDTPYRETAVKQREIGLLEGFLLCLRNSEVVRLQPSRWKRNLLVFSSGICLELALLPLLAGYGTVWQGWLLAGLFAPLGAFGLYASKFGDDRLVESLLVIPKLDLRI